MSQKIRSKDLSYDSNLPPFLQRLRGQHVGRGDNDRHEYQIARPKKAKVAEEEDEPTIVDESGELLSRAQLDQLKDKPDDEDSTVDSEQKQTDSAAASSTAARQANSSMTGVTKKRKVVKAIGDEDDGLDVQADQESAASNKKIKPVKKQKKSKPIKLAFDQDEDG